MQKGMFIDGVTSRRDDATRREEGGRWLRRRREIAGKTVLDVVEALGSDFPSFIGGIERGAHRPPATSYPAYAGILNMDRAEFAKAMLRYYDVSVYDCLFGARQENQRRKRTAPNRSTAGTGSEPVLLRPQAWAPCHSLSPTETHEAAGEFTDDPPAAGQHSWTAEERIALRTANCRWPFSALSLSEGAYGLSLYETADYAAASYVDRRSGHTVLVVHKGVEGIRFVDSTGRSMDKDDQDWMGRMFDLDIRPTGANQATVFRPFGPEQWQPLSFDDDMT
jgi:transcriptional regulator with XRE-family HTH domain